MTRENVAKYLPLVQALAEGKTIQVANRNKTTWIDLDEDIVWSENPDYYRIKPEPREWDLWERQGILVNVDMTNKDGWQKIRVREILD